jgi:hypothetical protein
VLGRALVLGFEHRLCHLLNEQRNAVAALDDVLTDVDRKQLVANQPIYDGTNLALWQSTKRKGGHVRSPDPGRLELWPKRHDQQHAEGRDLIHTPTENL